MIIKLSIILPENNIITHKTTFIITINLAHLSQLKKYSKVWNYKT